jgi:hypothetical protein
MNMTVKRNDFYISLVHLLYITFSNELLDSYDPQGFTCGSYRFNG